MNAQREALRKAAVILISARECSIAEYAEAQAEFRSVVTPEVVLALVEQLDEAIIAAQLARVSTADWDNAQWINFGVDRAVNALCVFQETHRLAT